MKVAVITGGSKGIGKQIVCDLVSRGIKVYFTFNKGREAANRLMEMFNPGSVVAIELDLRSKGSIERAIKEIKEEKIDFLLNNAGIMKDSTFEKIDFDVWEEVIVTNLTNTMYLTKQLLPKIILAQGRILNMTSMAAEEGSYGKSNYVAAKGGLIATTKTLARELAKYNVTVNSISPGLVDTSMIKSIPEDVLNKIVSAIPLKRIGSVEEISELVCFLLTNKGNYITGQNIGINGGLLM